MGSPLLEPGTPPGPSDLAPPKSRFRLPVGLRAVARLLTLIVLGTIAAQLFSLAAVALGLPWFATFAHVLQPILTVALLFTALHFFSMGPLVEQLQDFESKIQQLRSYKHQLEREVIDCDTELATARKSLQSETTLRLKRDQEIQSLLAKSEQSALERTAQKEAEARDLRAQIAELKRTAAAARENEKRFRRLVEIADEGIWTLNAQGITNFINQHGAELLGYPVPEILGQSPDRFLVTEELPKELHGFDLHHGSSPDPIQCRVRRKDGRPLAVRASACSIIDDEGDYLGALILFNEIVEGRHALEGEARIESSTDMDRASSNPQADPDRATPKPGTTPALQDRRLECARRLASGLANELNNALAPILLSSQILRSRLHPEDQDLAAAIQTSAERGAELLKQALIFSQDIEPERVDLQLTQGLKEIVELLREVFPRSIQVTCQIPKGLWTVKADPLQLKQVLLKLCINARAAMPGGGSLRIEAANLHINAARAEVAPSLQPGPYVVIEVHDTGPAIPPEVQDRIFEPFFTCSERGTKPGLGLSTVLAIVSSHGGGIDVQSQRGTGTKFTIYLPAISQPSPENAGNTVAEMPEGQGELILIVENDPGLRNAAQETLSRHGYRVLAATDGVEALGMLAEHQGEVRVILTNIVMSPMDGPALARAARQLDSRVRLIASTAAGGSLAQSDKLTALRSFGISRLLSKPYTAEQLLGTIRDELRAPAQE